MQGFAMMQNVCRVQKLGTSFVFQQHLRSKLIAFYSRIYRKSSLLFLGSLLGWCNARPVLAARSHWAVVVQQRGLQRKSETLLPASRSYCIVFRN